MGWYLGTSVAVVMGRGLPECVRGVELCSPRVSCVGQPFQGPTWKPRCYPGQPTISTTARWDG